MGFFKTSLAVTTGILGALGLLTFAKHLNESDVNDKIKDRVTKAATAAAKNNKEADA